MGFELCDKCQSVCDISITKSRIECIKCKYSKPIEDDYVIEDKSYSTSNTSLFDNYKILGSYDPKITLVEKKCPNCVGKNMHLGRMILTNHAVILKCKLCNYIESNT